MNVYTFTHLTPDRDQPRCKRLIEAEDFWEAVEQIKLLNLPKGCDVIELREVSECIELDV